MAEWFKAAVLKTVGCQSPVGSNPTPSASDIRPESGSDIGRYDMDESERWPSWLKALAC